MPSGTADSGSALPQTGSALGPASSFAPTCSPFGARM